MSRLKGDGVLVVMPTPATGAVGPVAVWITAAGWTAAARERWGRAWMVTPEGVLSAEEARSIATRSRPSPRSRRGWRRLVPTVFGTLKKDLRDLIRAARFRRAAIEGPWRDFDLAFVVQHHEMFQWSGFAAAEATDRPLVLFVDAPLVWEAERWGVQRPGWGRIVERIGETPQFRRADLLACVSQPVADAVIERGAPPERVLVTPCSADVDVFSPRVSGRSVRERFGLGDRFTVGWLGSFRRFHGVDLLLDAFATAFSNQPEVTLLLVGDGFERQALEERIATLGLRNVIFTGSVPHGEVPEYLAAMDVATVVDPNPPGTGEFHYSPLKVREYMATGLATVVPRSGQLESVVLHDETALVVPPGDRAALATALVRLRDEPETRSRIGLAARRLMEREGTWAHQIERVEEALLRLGRRNHGTLP